jgi:hypothetical protein
VVPHSITVAKFTIFIIVQIFLRLQKYGFLDVYPNLFAFFQTFTNDDFDLRIAHDTAHDTPCVLSPAQQFVALYYR